MTDGGYQVLARKYRPGQFSEVIGQEPVVRTLTNALQAGRIHHAYVFSGIRGVGKTTTARLLARALNCAEGPTPEPCGRCAACLEVTAGRSLDSIEIDAASNRGIDEVKGLIQNAQYAPARDRYKVFIVDEFHMLTREAFNALLKTLEEPPAHVVFILATTELEKVPATVLSRCLLLTFRAVSPARVREHLLELASREGVSLEPEAAELLARKAGGSLRDAQSTLDRVIALSGEEINRTAVTDVLGLVDAGILRGLLAAAARGEAGEALVELSRACEAGADLTGLLEDLLAEARAVLLTKVLADPEAALPLPRGEMDALRSLAELGSADDWRRAVELLIDAGPRLRRASQPRFQLEALIVRLAHLTRLDPLEEVLERLEGGSRPDPPEGGPGDPTTGRRAGAPERRPEPPRAKPRASDAAPGSPAGDPLPGRAEAKAADGGASSGGGWRERAARLAEAEPEEVELDDEVPVDPGAARSEPRSRPPVERRPPSAATLEEFRTGLPARVRALVDQSLLRPHEDGIALVLPSGSDGARSDLEQVRFHLMAAAAAAHGRPVPVQLQLADGLLDVPLGPEELAGLHLADRRRRHHAERSPLVRALVARFDGKVTDVSGSEPQRRRAR